MLNIQGMNPGINSQSFWKISKIKELLNNTIIKGAFTPFISIVESWIKPHITDTQLKLNNYQIFRCDRVGPKNGGVLLYVLNSIPIDQSKSFDDGICSCVVCLSLTRKCIIATFYRPPNASHKSFVHILSLLDNFILNFHQDHIIKTFIFGDFNFPGVRWDTGQNFSCPTYVPSFSTFLSFMNKYFLTQHITKNTRYNNILDLFLTNDRHFVRLVQIEKTRLSDHNIIYIHTSFFNNFSKNRNPPMENLSPHDFSKLNLRTSNVHKIKQEFAKTNWDQLILGPINDFPEKFNNTVYNIICKFTKLKTKNFKSHSSLCVSLYYITSLPTVGGLLTLSISSK